MRLNKSLKILKDKKAQAFILALSFSFFYGLIIVIQMLGWGSIKSETQTALDIAEALVLAYYFGNRGESSKRQ